ncbi:glycosyltransferase family 2 protein [Aequorivita sinensis]|uniref:glycosyltransferase family 2 protein n=1 Tax=Aequorivita sinensis TaxID=1382458 RepID=UPI0023019417|nr:glycosyltransferase family 2 protein [Aequorivita sinensis]
MEIKLSQSLPLVSVIITTYNRSVFLEKTIESIQSQTYDNLEILLIDDGSNKKIAAECEAITKKYSKCTYYYKPNTGQPDSRNYGIKRSKGVYIGFCDDDDYWVLDKIEKQVKILESQVEHSVVTGCIGYVNEKGVKLKEIKCHKGHNHGYVFDSFLIKNRTASVTPLLRREVFEKVGYFNPTFTIAEDWEFWRRVSYYYKFYNTHEVLAYVRLHETNMTNSRAGDPLEWFLLYRKLTKALNKWGENHFNHEDFIKINQIEWMIYRKILSNRFPGVLKKIKFIGRVFWNDPKNGLHFTYLLMRYGKLMLTRNLK